MDHTVLTIIIIGSFSSLIFGLGAIVWFAVTRWVTHVDNLQVAIQGLQDVIAKLDSKFVTREEHKKDLEHLRDFTQKAVMGSLLCPLAKDPSHHQGGR